MGQDVYPAIVKAITSHKQIDASLVSPTATLEQLGITSLDAISIVYEVEDLFAIEVPNEALENLHTVQDIVDGVAALVQSGSG